MRKRKLKLVNQSDLVIYKLFCDSFLVMMASELTVAVSKLIDSLMVSNFLGTEMFAAQSLANPFFSLIAVASGLLATGTQVIVSKHIVKGQFKESDQAFSLSLLAGLAISALVMIVCLIFGDVVPVFFGASRDDVLLYDSTKAYLTGLSLGTIPLILNVVVTPILQINGDRKRVKYTLFQIMGVNCIFNMLSIFVLKWGMFGVGLSTSIAEWTGLVVYLLHFKKRSIMCHIRLRGIWFRAFKNILIAGFPKATVRVCNTLRPLLINRWIMFLSTSAAMSAVGINNNIRDFFRIPETAVALAVMLIAGTFYGEQDKESLKKIVRIAMKFNVLINTALAVVIFASAPFWVSIYESPGTETFTMAITGLRWTAVGLFSYAVNEFFVDFMLGTGRHKQVHLFTICERFIYGVSCAYILGLLFGINGVLASFSVAEMCFTVHILIYVWVKNKKIPKELIQFMLLPKGFGSEPDMTLDYSISSMEEVVGVSETVIGFCRQKGVDHRRAYFAALCTEELASNIVDHGFSPDKPHCLMIRVLIVNDDLILRFRDSCRLFDIRERYDSVDQKDITKNIGIRMVMRVAKDVMYLNTLNLNTTIIKI